MMAFILLRVSAMISLTIVFGTQLVTALGHAPSLLLALAAAPLLQQSRLAPLLFAVDLALLLELVATQAEPHYAFGEALLARVLATATHVALACLLIRVWRRHRLDAAQGAARGAA